MEADAIEYFKVDAKSRGQRIDWDAELWIFIISKMTFLVVLVTENGYQKSVFLGSRDVPVFKSAMTPLPPSAGAEIKLGSGYVNPTSGFGIT